MSPGEVVALGEDDLLDPAPAGTCGWAPLPGLDAACAGRRPDLLDDF